MERFKWFAILHKGKLAEPLDHYNRLVVRWDDEDDTAQVYLIRPGGDLSSLPFCAFPSVMMRFASVRAVQ
jgi:hypothetical protein